MANTKFKVGDSVIVKPGTEDPDFGLDIGGWQGRIVELNEEDDFVLIQWDSLTLEQMPGESIAESIEQGLDWERFGLGLGDIELATPRDSEQDVDRVAERLEKKYGWSFVGPEGEAISAVLADVDEDDDWAAFKAWEAHLKQVLTFPFKAEVAEWQDRGSFEPGDQVKVRHIEGVEDLYGVMVSMRHKRKRYVFPLCDLEAVDESSPNHDLLQEYCVWFANR